MESRTQAMSEIGPTTYTEGKTIFPTGEVVGSGNQEPADQDQKDQAQDASGLAETDPEQVATEGDAVDAKPLRRKASTKHKK